MGDIWYYFFYLDTIHWIEINNIEIRNLADISNIAPSTEWRNLRVAVKSLQKITLLTVLGFVTVYGQSIGVFRLFVWVVMTKDNKKEHPSKFIIVCPIQQKDETSCDFVCVTVTKMI